MFCGSVVSRISTAYFVIRPMELSAGLFPTIAAGDEFAFEIIIPIVGKSSNVTMAERSIEEFSFNTTTNVATTDTTSFGYGSQGAVIQPITGEHNRRVRFTTPILPTDNIFVEVSEDRKKWFPTNNWVQVNGEYIQPFAFQGSKSFGTGRFNMVTGSLTDVDVVFGTYCRTSSSTYDAAGAAWGATAGAGYWRVRKVSGGASVGYPIGARNIVGDTTGTIPSNSNSAMQLIFSLGAGSNRTSGTLQTTWGAGDASGAGSATGQTNLGAAINNYWQITGVQWEVGTIATPFQTATGTIQGELAACQRYYWRQTPTTAAGAYGTGQSFSTTGAGAWINLPVQMRILPTAIEFSNLQFLDYIASASYAVSSVVIGDGYTTNLLHVTFTTATMTSGRFGILRNSSTAGFIGASAEL